MTGPVTIAVSSCLLGNRVRYDGGHKHDPYITGVLGKLFRLLPVCPELECGMPIPHDAMRLEGPADSPRLIAIRTCEDKTEQMLSYCRKKVISLQDEHLCGFILKERSPSCGLFRLSIYDETGAVTGYGRGLFADAVAREFARMPMEEPERLNNPAVRENFIERVYSYHRWKELHRFRNSTPL